MSSLRFGTKKNTIYFKNDEKSWFHWVSEWLSACLHDWYGKEEMWDERERQRERRKLSELLPLINQTYKQKIFENQAILDLQSAMIDKRINSRKYKSMNYKVISHYIFITKKASKRSQPYDIHTATTMNWFVLNQQKSVSIQLTPAWKCITKIHQTEQCAVSNKIWFYEFCTLLKAKLAIIASIPYALTICEHVFE